VKISREWGEDSEDAWNDKHFQHVYLWLTTNPNSPYRGIPIVLLAAMGIDPSARSDFKKCFETGSFARYRFGVRIRQTAAFKRVLAGLYLPEVTKRDKIGRVRGYIIRPAPNPQPLPCPPFYRGSINMSTKGLRVMLRQSDAQLAPMHNPDGADRLMNPWGKR
jgi:hypothetical protein